MSYTMKSYLLGVLLIVVILILATAARAVAQQGSTSQQAYTRCGETHLTVTANDEPVEVAMFNQYAYIEAGESAVFVTTDEVLPSRVTRRRAGQQFHTSVTSAFQTEQRRCTFMWATL